MNTSFTLRARFVKARIAMSVALCTIALCRVNVNAQEVEHTVDGPRPLGDAINVIERQCGCTVTYEDPIYDRTVLVDWTSQIRRDGRQEPKIFGPPSRLFTFIYDATVLQDTTRIESFLTNLVDQFNRGDRLGGFRVKRGGEGVYQIVPSKGASVLDVPVVIRDYNEFGVGHDRGFAQGCEWCNGKARTNGNGAWQFPDAFAGSNNSSRRKGRSGSSKNTESDGSPFVVAVAI